MADDPPVPEFTLPDWGTEGAPPEPTVPDDADDADDAAPDADQIEISVERPILLTAGALPAGWKVHTVHGLVTAHAKSSEEDPSDAAESASAKAMAELTDRARALGANAVTDLAMSVSGRKSKSVATVWGTAVTFSR